MQFETDGNGNVKIEFNNNLKPLVEYVFVSLKGHDAIKNGNNAPTIPI